MRKIKIKGIDPASGTISVEGDVSRIFKGKYFRHPLSGDILPAYTRPNPVGYSLIKATTFDIIDNVRYSGRYTVYTPVNATDVQSSTVEVGDDISTRIKVNEIIPPTDDTAQLTVGNITNISTYLLFTGVEEVVVPPGITITEYPVEFLGRDVTGWGEAFNQNFLNVARNFAHPNSPTNPFVGQTWYDTNDGQMRVYDGTRFELLNRESFGVTVKHHQEEYAAEWIITHNLNLEAPHIAMCQFFVDRGDGPKLIIPSDVTFVDANRIVVTFSNAERGWVLVRK